MNGGSRFPEMPEMQRRCVSHGFQKRNPDSESALGRGMNDFEIEDIQVHDEGCCEIKAADFQLPGIDASFNKAAMQTVMEEMFFGICAEMFNKFSVAHVISRQGVV